MSICLYVYAIWGISDVCTNVGCVTVWYVPCYYSLEIYFDFNQVSGFETQTLVGNLNLN